METYKVTGGIETKALAYLGGVFVNNQVNILEYGLITVQYKEHNGYINEINLYGENIQHIDRLRQNLSYYGFRITS